MGEVILVRHGQANSAATDEVNYDRLSDLGRQQARWLGEWFGDSHFDRVVCGTLQRQRDTAAEMGFSDVQIDPRLNELDYYTLSDALKQHSGHTLDLEENFVLHARAVLEAWERAEIQGQETFNDFESRVKDVLDEAMEEGVRVLCVTSGGVIGMMIRHLLDLDLWRLAQVMTPIFNTSVHHVHVTTHGSMLAGFNAIPHLEPPDRKHARTHY